MQNVNVTKVKNILEEIEIGKENTLTLENTNLWLIKEGITIPYQNILREHYRAVLINNSSLVKLTDKAMKLYKYRPKLFSLNLYGTTELWHLILWLNNMTSILEFNKNEIVVIDPANIDILQKILNQENNRLTNNQNNPMSEI